MIDHARVLARVLAGRKSVKVATWKWRHPQTIGTIDRVPLPLQRVPPRTVQSFSDYINARSAERKNRR
jgi:hypothetical protein